MKGLRRMLCILAFGLLLSGCGYEIKEYSGLTYKDSYRIDRGSDETPYTAIIFKTSDSKEKILFDDEQQSRTTLLQKGHKYNVTVSIANKFYYGDVIVRIRE
ncbi:hypothetical protein [Paenibacillus sp. USHLN196]|uniref:hypothetical protein n=1 Tax=Paenibacillus sp. USHLN196 TaxID=3081291 RepID=UPI003018554A